MEREFKMSKEDIRAGVNAPSGWKKIIATRNGDLIYFYEDETRQVDGVGDRTHSEPTVGGPGAR